MKTETKATPGALRAAKAIIDADDPTACTQFDYKQTVNDLAALIDRETNAPELLEIAEAFYFHINRDDKDHELFFTHESCELILGMVNAALAKAGVE
jgi:hypothetical protein